jgi:hypothetical protein
MTTVPLRLALSVNFDASVAFPDPPDPTKRLRD